MKRGLAFLLIWAPLMACGSRPSSVGEAHSGIRGVVLAAPACAAESLQTPCPDAPVQAEVVVREAASDGDALATVTTEDDGRFRIALSPGTYAVTARPVDGHLGSMGSTIVQVRGDSFTEVTLHVDTGIRGVGTPSP
jgi:hypothetical protein